MVRWRETRGRDLWMAAKHTAEVVVGARKVRVQSIEVAGLRTDEWRLRVRKVRRSVGAPCRIAVSKRTS